jgi:hypothetical protein
LSSKVGGEIELEDFFKHSAKEIIRTYRRGINRKQVKTALWKVT